jgi:hypothetical protein
MEALISGVSQEGQDEYIGWYGLSIEELFRYTWAIDVDYFFTVDSALMIASKGGFNINILNNMGIRTKKRYLDSLQDIQRRMNGEASESKTSGEAEEEIPTNIFSGG